MIRRLLALAVLVLIAAPTVMLPTIRTARISRSRISIMAEWLGTLILALTATSAGANCDSTTNRKRSRW